MTIAQAKVAKCLKAFQDGKLTEAMEDLCHLAGLLDGESELYAEREASKAVSQAGDAIQALVTSKTLATEKILDAFRWLGSLKNTTPPQPFSGNAEDHDGADDWKKE
jgi:hypothetical protein